MDKKPIIDDQLQEIYQLAIQIYDSMENGTFPLAVPDAIERISNLLIKHFAMEEHCIESLPQERFSDHIKGHLRTHDALRSLCDLLCKSIIGGYDDIVSQKDFRRILIGAFYEMANYDIVLHHILFDRHPAEQPTVWH